MSESLETRVKRIVCSTLQITEDRYSEELAAGAIPEWDSVAHVGLIMAIEVEFAIAFDVTDAVDVESVGDLLILLERYVTDVVG
jgi:acyl carrier protein